MSEQIELRECPFCGSPAEQPKRCDTDDSGNPVFGVECSQCPCENIWYKDAEDAIAAWNRRAECPDSVPVEKLRELVERFRSGIWYDYRAEQCADELEALLPAPEEK